MYHLYVQCAVYYLSSLLVKLYLQVACNGYFGDNNLPIGKLRKDVEILRITPTSSKCINVGSNGETRCDLVENHLTLGPIYKVRVD